MEKNQARKADVQLMGEMIPYLSELARRGWGIDHLWPGVLPSSVAAQY